MTPLKIMVNGLPGNVAGSIAKHLHADPRFELLPWSLTGPGIDLREFKINDLAVRLILPEVRDAAILDIKKSQGQFISVDFTLPVAVNINAEFYCRNHLPFVMGTTGGDRERLAQTVLDSSICAVIAPNMAKQIVGFQAMMEYAAENFPGLFDGYTLKIVESHQSGKVDTSGTAKAMVTYFNKLGTPYAEKDIIKIRDPEVQKNRMGIPDEYINGHAWHTYSLNSPDTTARFEFSHNINGRDIYAWGTGDAILFLEKKIRAGAKGAVFSMIDVLKGESK